MTYHFLAIVRSSSDLVDNVRSSSDFVDKVGDESPETVHEREEHRRNDRRDDDYDRRVRDLGAPRPRDLRHLARDLFRADARARATPLVQGRADAADLDD